MSIERSILSKLNESRRIDEAFPPILNALSKYEKSNVIDALIKAGIDIENTPYNLSEITNGRDPRLKGKNVSIFAFPTRGPAPRLAVWFNGKFIVDAYLMNANKNVSRMSWKDILAAASKIYTMEFDQATSDAMKQKQADRKEAQKGRVIRYTKTTKPRYSTLDKSGYIIDPNKYKKMFAEMNIGNGEALLKSARDTYVKLAGQLDKIDWTAEERISTFESYDYIMREILRQFQDLTRRLKEYEDYKKRDGENKNDWWMENLKTNVITDIKDLRDVLNKAKKYI